VEDFVGFEWDGHDLIWDNHECLIGTDQGNDCGPKAWSVLVLGQAAAHRRDGPGHITGAESDRLFSIFTMPGSKSERICRLMQSMSFMNVAD
jgi:hypothetical protein